MSHSSFSFPVCRNDLDFSQFYSAAQIIRQGLGTELYNLRVNCNSSQKLPRFTSFTTTHPFETLLFLPLTSFGYRVAYTIWTLVSVALLVVVARMLESHGNLSLALSQYARISVDFGLILVLFLTFAPATTSLLLGQDSADVVCAERLFGSRQLARTRLDCDLRTPSLG